MLQGVKDVLQKLNHVHHIWGIEKLAGNLQEMVEDAGIR